MNYKIHKTKWIPTKSRKCNRRSSFSSASHAVHACRLQRPHQPVSDWLQEHPHHHQHGVAELRRRVAEEEARRRRRLRRFMTARLKTKSLFFY